MAKLSNPALAVAMFDFRAAVDFDEFFMETTEGADIR